MEDDPARRLTQELPGPLDFATLRGNQVGPVRRPFDEAVTSLAVQLGLGAEQTWELMKKAIHCLKTSVNLDLLVELMEDLPEDWKPIFDEA